jgi:membrane protease YdiL (CAAX protease family)
MSSSESSAGVSLSQEPPIGLSVGEKRQRWFEVCLVLLVACGSPLMNALYLLNYGPEAMPHISTLRWTFGIVQELIGLAMLGYVLSRSGRRIANLGLRWSYQDIGVGLLLACISYATYFVGSLFVQVAHYAIYGSYSYGPSGNDFFAHPSVVVIPFTLLNPFFEELIVRAYLMTEVVQLTGSAALAVVVSVLVQSSYHLYYGWVGAISIAFSFLPLAIYFARWKRALPIVVAHGILDIYGLIRIW